MKKTVASVLVVLLIQLGFASLTRAQPDKDAQRFSKAKHDVEDLGFDAKVEVRLQDGSTLKGRITGIGDDQFVITGKDGTARKISYATTRRVRKDFGSNGRQLGELALIGVGLAGVLALIFYVGRMDSVTR